MLSLLVVALAAAEPPAAAAAPTPITVTGERLPKAKAAKPKTDWRHCAEQQKLGTHIVADTCPSGEDEARANYEAQLRDKLDITWIYPH